jgi:large subunit ribosomal protein L22
MKTAGSIAPDKTNERPGTRARVRYSRMSAWKARVVLDLIRGQSVQRAAEILQYTERGSADVIGKCLASAVANAVNNDGETIDELYVSACYADEGPTLKRWRPRARGRATRIRKRTMHLTIVVSRQEDEQLERLRARDAARSASRSGRTTQTSAESRRRRVAGSRAEVAPLVEAPTDDDALEDAAEAVIVGDDAGVEADSAIPVDETDGADELADEDTNAEDPADASDGDDDASADSDDPESER